MLHQRCHAQGRTILHYSLKECFVVQLWFQLTPSVDQRSSIPPITRLMHLASSAASFIFIFGLLLLFLGTAQNIRRDLANVQRSLDMHPIPQRPSWEDTVSTLTVTATVISRSDVTESPHTTPLTSTIPVLTQPTPVPIIDVSQSVLEDPSAQKEAKDTSDSSHRYDLVPLHQIHFIWPLRFKVPLTSEDFMDAVVEGFSALWGGLRRLYHYPLDPP